ncbi:hypothetical protein B9Z55_001275 [Caenorhabditis nigoni]|uniref:Uncharacterized protein n=1 Tax=Caenorhabditis nigoni TaxID=1611254 RepID=A0A2G5VEY3_9PELO|nr:hypothetical protein B9Z55_001275 [Caenorhabditis nigoni]
MFSALNTADRLFIHGFSVPVIHSIPENHFFRIFSISNQSSASWRRSKIAYVTHVSGDIAGNWEKFSTSNKRTSAKPHWSRYRPSAKLNMSGNGEVYMRSVYRHLAGSARHYQKREKGAEPEENGKESSSSHSTLDDPEK